MKRVAGWGVALILSAHAAFAGVRYEFIHSSRSDSDRQPASDFTATAVIDGPRSRVDFTAGTAYPPGTYVISTDGARKLSFVDPTQKLYTEVSTMSIASAIGTSNIVIDNFVPTVTKFDDTIRVAGITGEHYRLTMTYDITVNFRNMPLRQRVKAEIDKWTTPLFGDSAEAAFTNSFVQTGNVKIDELIAAETTKIKGFPLKQTVRISKTNLTVPRTSKSELKVPTVRTSTREMTVTWIGEVKADQTIFRIPAEYRKNDFASQVEKTQTQVLSVEPASN